MTEKSKPNKAWLYAGALVGGGFLFLVVYIAMQSSGGGETTGSSVIRYRVPLGQAPIKGPSDALVTIVEFSDFQCPHCSVLSKRLQRLFEGSPGDIRLVFRHAPLTSAHPHALAAAAASMAAHEQGHFWPYHDALFGRQDELEEGREFLEEIAHGLQLDIAQFQSDMNRYEQGNAIMVDRNVLVELGQGVVPVLFINGRLMVGAVPLTELVEVVEQERTRARQAMDEGVPRDQLYHHLISDGIGPDLEGAVEESSRDASPAPEDGGPVCGMNTDGGCGGDASL